MIHLRCEFACAVQQVDSLSTSKNNARYSEVQRKKSRTLYLGVKEELSNIWAIKEYATSKIRSTIEGRQW